MTITLVSDALEELVIYLAESSKGADQIAEEHLANDKNANSLDSEYDVGYYRGKRDAYRNAATKLGGLINYHA